MWSESLSSIATKSNKPTVCRYSFAPFFTWSVSPLNRLYCQSILLLIVYAFSFLRQLTLFYDPQEPTKSDLFYIYAKILSDPYNTHPLLIISNSGHRDRLSRQRTNRMEQVPVTHTSGRLLAWPLMMKGKWTDFRQTCFCVCLSQHNTCHDIFSIMNFTLKWLRRPIRERTNATRTDQSAIRPKLPSPTNHRSIQKWRNLWRTAKMSNPFIYHRSFFDFLLPSTQELLSNYNARNASCWKENQVSESRQNVC